MALFADRYQLQEPLGSGGMGTVHKAYDTELRRAVAIKRLHEVHEPQTQARFLREAKLLARLKHPNLVELLDFGEWQGSPYLVMEFLRGESLWLGCHDPLEDLLEAGEALEALHQEGVIHRDFKPDNVLRLEDSRVVLVDLGLSRATGSLQALTETGTVLGTHGYMAPEILTGSAMNLPSSDWFAWGVSLFHLSLRRPPYRFEDLWSYCRDGGSWPVDWTGVDELSVETRQILEALLVPAPEDRPQDLSQIQALRRPKRKSRSRAKAPVEAPEASSPPKPERRSSQAAPRPAWGARRNALGLLGACLLVGLSLSWVWPSGGAPPSSPAEPLASGPTDFQLLEALSKTLGAFQTRWSVDHRFVLDHPPKDEPSAFLRDLSQTYAALFQDHEVLARGIRRGDPLSLEVAEGFGACFHRVRSYLLYCIEAGPRGHLVFSEEPLRNHDQGVLEVFQRTLFELRIQTRKLAARGPDEAILAWIAVGPPEALGWTIPPFRTPFDAGRFPLLWLPESPELRQSLRNVLPRLSLLTLERLLTSEGALDLRSLYPEGPPGPRELIEKIERAATGPPTYEALSDFLTEKVGAKLFRTWLLERIRTMLYVDQYFSLVADPKAQGHFLDELRARPFEILAKEEGLAPPGAELLIRSFDGFGRIRGDEPGRAQATAVTVSQRLKAGMKSARNRYCRALAGAPTFEFPECEAELSRIWEELAREYGEKIAPPKVVDYGLVVSGPRTRETSTGALTIEFPQRQGSPPEASEDSKDLSRERPQGRAQDPVLEGEDPGVEDPLELLGVKPKATEIHPEAARLQAPVDDP